MSGRPTKASYRQIKQAGGLSRVIQIERSAVVLNGLGVAHAAQAQEARVILALATRLHLNGAPERDPFDHMVCAAACTKIATVRELHCEE